MYDCSGLLTFDVFQELQDKNYFKQVRVLDGTVVSLHQQDICPSQETENLPTVQA